jgi:hypothetical protein
MDLQSTGDHERKRACALDLARKVLTLRSFCYSPFWEDIHKNWVAVLLPGIESSVYQWPDQRREERAKPTIVAAKSTLVSPPQKSMFFAPRIFCERATLVLHSSSLPLGRDAAPSPAASPTGEM